MKHLVMLAFIVVVLGIFMFQTQDYDAFSTESRVQYEREYGSCLLPTEPSSPPLLGYVVKENPHYQKNSSLNQT